MLKRFIFLNSRRQSSVYIGYKLRHEANFLNYAIAVQLLHILLQHNVVNPTVLLSRNPPFPGGMIVDHHAKIIKRFFLLQFFFNNVDSLLFMT